MAPRLATALLALSLTTAMLASAIEVPGPIFSEPWLIRIQDDDAPKVQDPGVVITLQLLNGDLARGSGLTAAYNVTLTQGALRGALALAYQLAGVLNPAATGVTGAPTGDKYANAIAQGTLAATAKPGLVPTEVLDIFFAGLCSAMDPCYRNLPNWATSTPAQQTALIASQCSNIVSPTLSAFMSAFSANAALPLSIVKQQAQTAQASIAATPPDQALDGSENCPAALAILLNDGNPTGAANTAATTASPSPVPVSPSPVPASPPPASPATVTATPAPTPAATPAKGTSTTVTTTGGTMTVTTSADAGASATVTVNGANGPVTANAAAAASAAASVIFRGVPSAAPAPGLSAALKRSTVPSLFSNQTKLTFPQRLAAPAGVTAGAADLATMITTAKGQDDLAFTLVKQEVPSGQSVATDTIAQLGLAYAYCGLINSAALTSPTGGVGQPLTAAQLSGLGRTGSLTATKILAAQNSTTNANKLTQAGTTVDVSKLVPSDAYDIHFFGIGCALETCINSFPEIQTPSKLDPATYYTDVRLKCGPTVQPALAQLFAQAAADGNSIYAAAALTKAQAVGAAANNTRVPNLLEDLNKYTSIASAATPPSQAVTAGRKLLR